MDELIGKTISKVDYDSVYKTALFIECTDGTTLKVTTGKDFWHNDFFRAVECEINSPEPKMFWPKIKPKSGEIKTNEIL